MVEPDYTGHADHFLSRLDRLEQPLVELALSLYNDVPLLRQVLALARVPEQAERVALSLADPVEGPFLLVTREGHFVTCLGRGMSPGSLPIITRQQLDTIADKFEDLRRRIAEADRQSAVHTDNFLARIYEVGPWLSREEMIGLSSFAPMLSTHLLGEFIETDARLIQIRMNLGPRRQRRKMNEEGLHAFHRLLWGAAHTLVLLGAGARQGIEAFDPVLREKVAAALSCSFDVFDMPCTIMRSAWAAGRLAKVLFPVYKQQLVEADHPTRLRHLAMGLTTMGLRHRAFEVDVRRALVRHRFAQLAAEAQPEEAERAQHYLKVADLVTELCLERLDNPAQALASLREASLSVLARLLVRRSPQARMTRGQFPDEAVFAALPCASPPLLTEHEWLQLSCVTPPFLATAKPEDLYLPTSVLDQVRVPWSPAEALAFMEPINKPVPVAHAQTPPGRNEACSCGSGKKSKRCCGR